MDLAERLWAKVDIRGDDECWPWQAASMPRGYGVLRVDGVLHGAHRLVWALTHDWPGAMHVLHRCDNPACCNPAHLWLGTHAENMADKDAKGRGNRPVWHGEKHPMARLSDEDVATIRQSHLTTRELSKRFGVTPAHIRRVVRGDMR